MAYISFEELAKDRSDWYKLSKKIGFIEGIERLLTQLYPDKAHFIYELLQNAEDAKATRVEFHLEKDSLVFIHDGKRLFNLRDVESITSIADSTKREDGTSIGKFGIGFKAVFAYTDTPTIHSGEWNFQISHMVVPERCSADPSYRDQTAKTIFRFPFDKARKPADKAYSEVLEGLSLLESESILFLQNISEVYVSYAGKEQFITKSKRQSLIELVKLTGEGQSTSCHYLQFSKTVSELTLEDGTTVDSLPVGVAYRLKERSGARAGVGLKLSDRFDVVPVDRRNVFVFFPADKETSGLRFCVHGPFASTAARDSICDTVDNRKLMEIVSNLQVESLTMLKEDGFISTDFLEVLPNSRDNIGGMYECFHRNLVSVFKTQPFTPKKYGGYAPADELRRGPAALSDIFDDADLSDLTWSLDVAWAKNANRQNSPADVFLSDLDIGEWGTDDLIRVLSCFSDGWKEEEQEEAIVRLLEKKTNVQLTALYALLEDYLSGRHYYDDPTSDLRKALLFRLSDGTFACASEGLVSGIPIENASGDVTVRYIHPAITGEECPPKNKERVDRFLKRMGIEPFSEAVMMRLFVSQFWSAKEKVLTTEQSVRNLKAMLRLVQSGEVSHEVAQQLPVLNSDERIVRLNTTFLDDPYVSTGLSAYAEPLRSVGVTRLSPSYAELLGGKLKKEFVEKCAAFGVRQELWLVDSPYYMNPRSSELHDFSRRSSSYERGSDYDIPGIAKFVSSPTVEQAKLIWEFVLARPAEYLIAEYHANASDPGRRVPAKYIYTLTHAAWIPVGGIRKKPSELSLQDIPGDWRRPKDGYEHRALKAMNFGQETEKRRAEQEQRVELLKKSGFDSAEEVADLQNIKKWCQENGMTVKQFLSRISGEKKPGSTTTRPPKPLPKRSASNVNQRMSTASSRFEKAAEQTYVVVGRSVHVGNSHTRDAARTYLRSEYEGDGEMFCQLCHNTMPFRGRDGLGYFEATQVFLRMKKDVAEQFISLCPTCRAKYDEWVRRSQDRSRAFKEAILKHLPQQGEDGVMIPLPGAEENGVKSPLSGKSVYFTGTHFVDLRQAVLENEKLGGLDEFTGVEMATASSPTKKSFLDWYVQYDSEGAALLQKAGDAFARLEVCRREKKKEASCITVGLFDTDSGVKRCEHGARSAECLQRAA